MPDIGCAISTHDAHRRRADYQGRHHRHQARYLGQDEKRGRVDAHNLKGVYLLGHTHGAQLRGDVGAHLAREDETHDGARKLEQHNLAGGIPRHPARHPGALDIHLHLYADYGADEEGDKQHDGYRVYAQLRHLLDIPLGKHAHPLGHAERAPHQDEVFAESGEIFL